MRLARSNGWRRRVAIAAVIAMGALGLSASAQASTADHDTVRDHPMGSQIAKHEGGAVRTMDTGDDPSTGTQGIDVSRWQGEVDWQYWWNQGKRFAYVKASEGTYVTNPHFGQQYNGSAEVGMKRGAYHFAIPNDSTGTAQADYFVDSGGGWARDGKTLPGVIDLEHNPNREQDGTNVCYGMTKTALASWITAFIDTYKQRTGRFPVIYTSTGWWTQCVDSAAFGETSPLWIARWNTEVGTLPNGWSTWTFWQYTDKPIDQDKFYGTSSQLQQLVDGPTPTAPTSVSATGGVQRATVSWQEPRWTGVGGVTKYRISVTPGDKVIDDIPPSARSQTVTGLAIGTSYTFAVRAYSADGAGAFISKRLIGMKLTPSLSPSTLTYGTATKFSGKVYRVDTGTGTSGWPVTLQERRKGGTTWSSITSVKTGAEGAFAFTVKPYSSRDYRAVYASGNTKYLGAYSAPKAVTVRQAVSGAFNDSTVTVGTTVKFSGKVSPTHAGQTVYLQRYVDGKWTTVASRTLSSTSTYSFSMTRSYAGTFYYRAYKPGHTDHSAGYSPSRKLVVSP